MSRTNRQWLESMAAAAQDIAELTADISFVEYRQDRKTRAAVERQFISIGESLSQLERQAPEAAAGIARRREIIGMRIILTHRFYEVDTRIVWNTIINDLPLLRAEVRQLLNSAAADP